MTKDMFNLLNSPFFVGFERIHDRMNQFNDTLSKNAPSYPPYNIHKDDDQYIIEMAVAGFTEDDIDIEVQDDVLKVVGSASTSTNSSSYLHRGIANRGFTRNFNLAETIEVKSASLINGMLQICLENIVPENKKPRKVNINKKEESKEEPRLLNE
jgi:molecular chaperone IbpA|tara:strand:- start:340 stop:804 length:465 start_codon:yes stop_codon:yes gene_type:complete